jgi:hypothetical protein
MIAQGAVPNVKHGTTGQLANRVNLKPTATACKTTRPYCAVIASLNAFTTGIRGSVSPPAG